MSAYSSVRHGIAGPMDKIYDMLNRCGKRLDVATRKAESLADSVWSHRES